MLRPSSHSRGTVPVTCSQIVLQARPHGVPISNGSYSWPTASSNGTGSSGTFHADTCRAMRCGCTFGATSSSWKRPYRPRNSHSLSRMEQSFHGGCGPVRCSLAAHGPTSCDAVPWNLLQMELLSQRPPPGLGSGSAQLDEAALRTANRVEMRARNTYAVQPW